MSKGSQSYLNFNSIAVVVLVISLIYSPMLESYLPFSYLKESLVVIFMIMGTYLFLVGSSLKVHRGIFIYTFLALSIMLISLLFWNSISTIGSYLSVLIVLFLFLFNRANSFEVLLKYTLIISVIIALGEIVTGKYLYVVSVTVNGQLFTLDEKLFSGSMSIFRAKGLFEGPLTFAQFCVFVSLIFFNDRRLLLIAFIGALTTSSRMAIFVTFAIVLFQLYLHTYNGSNSKYKAYKVFFIFVFIAISIMSFSTFLYLSDSDFSQRLAQTFDFSSSASNNLRLYFWKSSLNVYAQYDFAHLIFGNNGYFREQFDNNAESGWLTLLVDNGLSGLLYYLLPCLFLFYVGFQQKRQDIMFFSFVYLLVNSTMTFYLSASGNVLYWYLIFKWIQELSGEKKTRITVK